MTVSKSLHIENKKGLLWVTLPSIIKRDNSLQIQSRIENALDTTITRVFLDLSYMSNLYSITITFIMHIKEVLSNEGFDMCLINVSGHCMKQLKLMKLDSMLTIYESEKDYILDKQ